MQMEFVYSLWSKNINPFFNKKNSISNLGSESYRLLQKTSLLLLKKHFPNVPITFYTDEYGKTLIESLNVKIDNLYVTLDRFNDLSIHAWPYVKLRAITEHSKPLIHIDYDVFLRSNFLDKIKNYKVVYQSYEPFLGHPLYESWMRKNQSLVRKLKISEAVNAGFTYWNLTESEYEEVDVKITEFFADSSNNVNDFIDGMVLEQIILPYHFKKKYRENFYTLKNLEDTTHRSKQNQFINEIPLLRYQHYAAGLKRKQENKGKIATEYRNILNLS